LKITILGSGTSHGVPMIGCECAVCRSGKPENQRFRASIMVETDLDIRSHDDSIITSIITSKEPLPAPPQELKSGGATGEGCTEKRTILVDTTPELRLQALTFGIKRVDAVLFTHTHADHVMGLDDMRRFNEMYDMEIPVYGDRDTLNDIRRIFPYIFRETLQQGGGKPRLRLVEVERGFHLFGLDIRSFYVMHGKLPVLAYRFDHSAGVEGSNSSCAYVTDVNHIPDEAMGQLAGLDLLILDAVRFEPHSTHFGLYEALDVIKLLQPRQALITHVSHHFDHDTVNASLPDNVRLAFDGQTIVL